MMKSRPVGSLRRAGRENPSMRNLCGLCQINRCALFIRSFFFHENAAASEPRETRAIINRAARARECCDKERAREKE
jgi:hypothetical protein